MHTPGPWEQIHSVVRKADALSGTTPTIAICDFVWGSRVAEANARLIAAAPDLLAALKRLAEWEADRPLSYVAFERIREQARAAIARAEGKE